MPESRNSRRRFLKQCAGLSLLSMPGSKYVFADTPIHLRPIPKTGESIPAVGMGTWLTFAVGDDSAERATRVEVLRAFLKEGGRLIDSSPMYGSSEEVIGYCLKQLHAEEKIFAATKVWTAGWQQGVRQMRRSQALWGVKRFDLMQVHNLLDWRTHLATLKSWKQEGRIRYIGVTTSHGRRHPELEKIMATESAIDFVQFTYNIEDREVEQRLLPLAAERKLAVIVNRPFQGGNLFQRVAGKPLPAWAGEIDCHDWAQFFLKFIISHPGVTCAIPATSRVEHMRENMGSLRGRLPDASLRNKMINYYESLT
ncbi:MAG: aldo/keto reductase [Gammaproteobacteria bacterium]|nr:aldo/keto reductase [Gammaproteobacteria bacterium]